MAANIPAPNLPRKRKGNGSGLASKKLIGIAAGGALAVCLLSLAIFGIASAVSGGDVEGAVVRVATQTGSGTGFFVEGPDEHAYVATAFHVVDKGESILIERIVTVNDETRFVEAYPETEVVAFDADADIAIIRIKNVRGDKFAHLELAEQPAANEKIRAYGYPGSNITRRTGLIAKDGKLLSLVKFPVYDRRQRRVVRDNAVDGLLVSAAIEPGFSGGPTLNDDDEVVGINVTKDQVHRDQNGVVHVKLLRALLETVEPLDEATAPTTKQVSALLDKLQKELLLLPNGERRNEREHGFVSTSELPQLRRLIDEVRRHERDSHVKPGATLSGRAAFGMWAAQLPGKPLSTYLSGDVQDAILACERSSIRLVSLFNEVDGDDEVERAALRHCDDLALRPIAWDLMAATMQWTGEERDYSVTKLERVDDAAEVYRAKVRVSDMNNLLTLWVTVDYGQLRIKLFDDEGKLYGVKSAADDDPSELAGEWQLLSPRAPSHGLVKTDQETAETISVSIQGEAVTVKHTIKRQYFATTKFGRFRCNSRRDIENGWAQSFSGSVENGVIVAKPKQEAKPIGRDANRCKWGYRPDVMASFKLINGKLTMYRTDGINYPEAVELERKNSYAPSE
jgi:S1-C subfamily serine protease